MAQSNNTDTIDPNWILLDTCSSDSVFRSSKFVSNITQCSEDNILNIISNGGSYTYDTTATFDIFSMLIYFKENTLANVLSFKQIAALPNVKITTDTSIAKAISVHVGDKVFKFEECNDGLYYLDMKKQNNLNNQVNNYSSSSNNICLLNTIDYNKSLFTKMQIRKAEKARNLQQLIG